MKTIIYYFTGTGNSLAAAKKVATILGDCELLPIASLKNTNGEIVPQAERVGIVCPVYDAGLPRIVAEFAGQLDISHARHSFAIVTLGGTGVSALHQLNGILSRKSGRRLDSVFAVKMPGNFPPFKKIDSPENRKGVLKSANSRLAEIAEIIDKGTTISPRFSPLSSLVKFLTYGRFIKNVHGADKDFSVSDTCTSCGICVKVCPVGNITLEHDRPSWQHHCELCCACLNFCPSEAIQLAVLLGSEGRGRYRHPGVRIEDLKAQRGEKS
jgi:ferredoxin